MTPRQLVREMKRQGLRVALAESCTGGLVAAAITSVPGSSEVFDRGFVTYSNAAKQDCLAVSATLLKRHGAVSEETARAMAKGALANSVADIAVSVTGIAGPGGGSPDKPVGTVCFGAVRKGQRPISLRVAYGDIGRQAVRRQSVRQALALLEGLLSGENRQRPRLKG